MPRTAESPHAAHDGIQFLDIHDFAVSNFRDDHLGDMHLRIDGEGCLAVIDQRDLDFSAMVRVLSRMLLNAMEKELLTSDQSLFIDDIADRSN